MENRKIKAVLFDMDGVLVDSEPVIEAAALAALREYGVEAHPRDFIPFIGAGDDRYIGGAAEKYGLKYEKGMKDRLYEIYLRLAEDKMGLFEGASPLLSKLAEGGFLLALATSADRIKVRANLKAAGISEDLFSCVITGEDVSEKKPSPEIYLEAAQGLGVLPRECVVVEDAINGVASAGRAGMLCIGLSTSFPAGELEKAGADFVLGDIAEVYGVIEKINDNQAGG